MKKALSGAEAVGEAMRQVGPDVVAAYPITPQTEIMHRFSKYVADGKVKTEFILPESEHSAMSACIGACAAGARTMTATSANGLAFMWEVLYVAASMRLPITMAVVNRALSGPLNIHNDHSDSMGCRDSGWLQLYAENAQEAYDHALLAVRIAEHPDILLPVMCCQDGFITSHSVESVDILPDELASVWIGGFVPRLSLLKDTVTFGPLDLQNYYFEHKVQQAKAMENALATMPEIFKEYEAKTGRKYGLVEKYRLEDATVALVCMSSSCGTIKDAVDILREKGIKAGLLKIRSFRPFPTKEIAIALSGVGRVAILDKSLSFGAPGGPLFMEVQTAIPGNGNVMNFIYGLGGRDFSVEDAINMFNELADKKTVEGSRHGTVKYWGVRE